MSTKSITPTPAALDDRGAGESSGHSASVEDLAYVHRLLNRDEAAFVELVDRYDASLLRLALVFVSTPAAAQEVVQDTWMGVLSGLRAFEGRSALKTWIFRILTNRAKTKGIREGRSVPFSALDPDGDSADGPAVDPARFNESGMWERPPKRWVDDTPEKLLMDKEALACIERAIETLPAQQRAVITLRDVEGLESPEVCNVLEISETNQRVLLHRARSKVRNAVEKYLT
ncbi:MAG: sigma-70 family RNA polymerase sigma factor [Polyangiaceae bacterium]